MATSIGLIGGLQVGRTHLDRHLDVAGALVERDGVAARPRVVRDGAAKLAVELRPADEAVDAHALLKERRRVLLEEPRNLAHPATEREGGGAISPRVPMGWARAGLEQGGDRRHMLGAARDEALLRRVQVDDARALAVLDRDQQRRLAAWRHPKHRSLILVEPQVDLCGGRRVDERAGGEQTAEAREASVLRRVHEGRPSFLVGQIDVDAGAHEHVEDAEVAAQHAGDERRLARLDLHVPVGSVLDQHVHDLGLACLGRKVKHRAPPEVAHVHATAIAQVLLDRH
mmetsp:Transcript_5053/g.16435  ORF Transcript_5053/g.16435 Transcript_5053/m.16435 type:complete len:285 (-) Transcript_5053:346-1200(-)